MEKPFPLPRSREVSATCEQQAEGNAQRECLQWIRALSPIRTPGSAHPSAGAVLEGRAARLLLRTAVSWEVSLGVCWPP